MATLSVWCLLACVFVLFAGITAIDETRYVRAGTDETLSFLMSGTVVTASWFYCESCDRDAGDSIHIAVTSVPDTSYPRKDRIDVLYDTNNGVYDLTLLNFNGQTDVGIYYCSVLILNSGVSSYFFTVEFADGPSTASITGNVPVFADESSSLTLTCAAAATPSVTFQWKNGNNIIGYSSTLTSSPVRADNGVTITCTAMNREYDDIRASDSVTLEVHYGPDSADIVGTSTVYADDVNTLTFTCTAAASYPRVRFQWTKGGLSIGGNSDTLTFTPVPTDDGKDVVCIATNTGHIKGQARDNVVLTVYYGPNSVTITGNDPVYDNDANTLTLECTAKDYNPDVVFQWKEGNQNINGETTNKYTKIADKSDNGRTIKCLAWNSLYPSKIKEASAQVTVYYSPHNTDILISVLNPREGDDVTVLCTCDSNPAPSFTITGPAGDTHSQNRLYLENIFRADSGTYACTAGNEYGTQTKVIAILVYYAPEITVKPPLVVSEGDRGVELLCEANDIPDSYNFGEWRHLGPTDYIEVRKLDGTHTGNQSLLVFDKPLTQEDSGYYECNVNNGVLDQTEKLDQSERKYLHVTGVPTFLEVTDTTYGEIGQNVKVEVSFYSVPEYTDVTWFTLSSSGQQNVLDRSLNIEQTIDQRILDTTYHGIDVAVNGYIAVLVFKNMTLTNTGSYVVVITNEKGQTSYLKKLDKITETDDLTTEDTTDIPIAGAVTETDDFKIEDTTDIPIAGAVAGSVGVFLIVIAIVVVVLWRRGVITKPTCSCLKDNESSGKDVYQNQAFDPVSAEGSSTNEAVYQDIGPSENPAMHYESVTQSDIATVHKTS